MHQIDQLHFSFFPLMAQGHMLPTIDMANLFSTRGSKVTLITTHAHVPMFTKATEKSRELGFDISVLAIKFRASEAGLPEGTESLDQVTNSDDMLPKFMKAIAMLQEPLEQLLQEHQPHCLVADMFFPWTTEAAAKFGIPRLLFHGSSSFALSASDSLRRNRPFDGVSSDSEPFVIPDLPHEIKLTRSQVSIHERDQSIENEFTKLIQKVRDSEATAFGVVNNSFYELETDYADYYINVLGRKAWNVGPFLLCNKDVGDKAQRGKKSAVDAEECLKWLDSKQQNSVIYICFGSMANFCVAQLHEIAAALEASGQQFVWVVRNCRDEKDEEKWFPEGFEEESVKSGKGLVIKGWAPQQLILEHEAVGAFVTHCGWNSTLEGICAGGVPTVTWPLFAEQFLNEKFLTDVVKIGVPVGSQEWSRVPTAIIKREAITSALNRVMAGDEEALQMRARAKALKEKARKAVEEGGSSYSDLTALFDELRAYHSSRN